MVAAIERPNHRLVLSTRSLNVKIKLSPKPLCGVIYAMKFGSDLFSCIHRRPAWEDRVKVQEDLDLDQAVEILFQVGVSLGTHCMLLVVQRW